MASIFSGLSGTKSDMAMAHVSRHTAVLHRTLALSAGRVQLQLLIGLVLFVFLVLIMLVILLLSFPLHVFVFSPL